MGLAQAIAEEVAQETFIRAWQAREKFEPNRAAVSTWLFTIARRLAINELQRAAYRYEQANIHEASITNYADENQMLPSLDLSASQQRQMLHQALHALCAHDRSLLALAYLKELKFSDIAQIESIPVGTVKSRLYRIKQELKTTLNKGKDDG